MNQSNHQQPAKPETGKREGSAASRCFHLLCRVVRATGCALLERRFATTILIILIALELTVFGIGVTRKLDAAYELETNLARTHLAVVEAQLLAKGMTDTSLTEGSAGIGATTAPEPLPAPVPSEDEAPPLRPRDIQTIVAQEASEWNEANDPVLSNAQQQQAPAETEEASALAEGSADSAPSNDTPPADEAPSAQPLPAEDAAELDRLIRQGVAAMTAGDMRRCVLSFEQARTINPEHPALLYYYGLAYDKLLNPNRAREHYMKLFHMRDRAGKYFERASRRLTYGLEQPSAMRGKLAFGPHQVRHSYDENEGERVSILLPVLLAPGEEVRPDDLYVTFQAFDLVNGRKIEFARLAKPQMAWEKGIPTWSEWEENLRIEYAVPPLTNEELEAYGDLKYYGFTAKLYYKGEPLDCISSPSALILQEQRLLSRRASHTTGNLLPDDGLESEESMPASNFLNDIDNPLP